mmetsp:Transcript_22456/g.41148  ORF Transcript_22456/g.41148 Transcript_22456/m.41148 type:complete len:137 (-) Transcript_22456:873-1283(-)
MPLRSVSVSGRNRYRDSYYRGTEIINGTGRGLYVSLCINYLRLVLFSMGNWVWFDRNGGLVGVGGSVTSFPFTTGRKEKETRVQQCRQEIQEQQTQEKEEALIDESRDIRSEAREKNDEAQSKKKRHWRARLLTTT